MGNSTGMIVPHSLLSEIGIAIGTSMDIRVEGGKLVATPIIATPREGWAEDAAKIGPGTEEEAEWRAFGNDGDADLEW